MTIAMDFALENWLKEHGRTVVTAVTGGDAPTSAVKTSIIVEHQRATTFSLDVDGKKVVTKVFDKADENARNSTEREVFALTKLADTGLAPALVAFSQEDAFVVSEFVQGKALADVLDKTNLTEMCHTWGRWLAQYIEPQPTREVDTDWYSYLSLYRGVITDDVRDDAKALLGGMKIDTFALSKHDMAPENFIVKEDGTFVGIDYERSRFKPVAWDIVAAAWVLIKRFEGREDDFIPALIEGWTEAGTVPAPDGLEDIARFFARQAKNLTF